MKATNPPPSRQEGRWEAEEEEEQQKHTVFIAGGRIPLNFSLFRFLFSRLLLRGGWRSLSRSHRGKEVAVGQGGR